MLKGSAATSKMISEMGQLFRWRIIEGEPYFELVTEDEASGDAYFEQLKKDAQAQQLNSDLFNWDPKTLTIRMTKANFIRWQKRVLNDKFEGRKRILFKNRTFFECENVFFTIPLKKESVQTLKFSLQSNAKIRAVDVNFCSNKAEGIVEIKKAHYQLFNNYTSARKLPDLSKRKFDEDQLKNCYFTCPVKGESLEQLKRKFRIFLKRKKQDADIVSINIGLNRLEVSTMDFCIVQKFVLASKTSKIAAFKRKFKEEKDCFYTLPIAPETVADVYAALKLHFNGQYPSLEVNLIVDEEKNRVCIDKDKYVAWQEIIKNKKVRPQERLRALDFSIDEDNKCYRINRRPKETLSALFFKFQELAKKLLLSPSIFHINSLKDGIEISAPNYELFRQLFLDNRLAQYKAYQEKATLTLDKKRNVYFNESNSSNRMARSFRRLAKLLQIEAKFISNNNRTEISVEDYERWIAHPIIKKHWNIASEGTSAQELTVQSRKDEPKEHQLTEDKPKEVQPKTARRKQTIENTHGGISAKYLEDAIPVALSSGAESSDKENGSLLSKGRIIPFQPFSSTLQSKDGTSLHCKVTLKAQGIKGDIKFYSSEYESIRDVFSKDVVFVRAGRKEAALVPAVKQNSQSSIVVLMTQFEYDDMTKKLNFSPAKRLPSHIKLCIIESCTLKKQPSSEPASYIKTSNIKRAVAYAIAYKYELKHFLLMDDNTTQIQIAENIASEGTIDALFQLFAKYKARGTVCATLGTYAPYKNISHFLDASEIEGVHQKLGSKIMYVDFETLRCNLEEKNRQLHEIISPLSLYWGEDYYNESGIINTMQGKRRKAIVGVVPFSVAWHVRSQEQVNKTKSNPDFKLANHWLSLSSQFVASLTAFQRQIVNKQQNLVKEAIDKQDQKEQRYLEKLENIRLKDEVSEIETNTEASETSDMALGKLHGKKAASRGYELNKDKLIQSVQEKYPLPRAREYIEGFIQTHEATWSSLTPESRAYGRGYQEGYLAAKQGFKTDEALKRNIIPSLYQEQAAIFEKGFRKGNQRQWEMMITATEDEVKTIAREMGAQRANIDSALNQEKLDKIAANFGKNAVFFRISFQAGFTEAKVLIKEKENIIQQAEQVARKLSQTEPVLNITKLIDASKRFGKNRKLYETTVVTAFNLQKKLYSTAQEKHIPSSGNILGL